MPSRYVAIELLPDRLQIAVVRQHRVVRAQRLSIELESEPAAWISSLRQIAPLLRDAVTELKVVGWPAVVLHRSPTASVDLSSLPMESASQAVDAAKLGCLDSLSYSSNAAIVEAMLIGRDRRGEHRQHHLVTAAERDDCADALAQCVEAAGLKFTSATPMDAVTLWRVAGDVFREKSGDVARLFVGEHSSHFVVGGAGRIIFGRSIGLSLAALTRSLTRPIRPAEGEEPVELTSEQARQILFDYGVDPPRDQTIPGTGLTGAQLLPPMQPVLQRCVVELRQSLRFGLPDEMRERLQVQLTGPGVQAGLAEMLERELGVPFAVATSSHQYDDARPASEGGELAEGIRRPDAMASLALLPQEVNEIRRVARLKRWLWTGAAAALALVGVDWVRYDAQLSDLQDRASALETQAAMWETMQATREKLQAALDGVTALQGRLDEKLGQSMNPRAILQEISALAPEAIDLTAIGVEYADGRLRCTLEGYALLGENAASSDDLITFVDRLKQSPLFRDVVLENVQAGLLGEQHGERFTASMTAIGVPAVQLTAMLGEAAP